MTNLIAWKKLRVVMNQKSTGLSFVTNPPSRTTVAHTNPTVPTLLAALVKNISRTRSQLIFSSGLSSPQQPGARREELALVVVVSCSLLPPGDFQTQMRIEQSIDSSCVYLIWCREFMDFLNFELCKQELV